MASAGIHSILVVFSLKSRYSKEEVGAILHCLKKLFGEKIYDCMIVVFTGGDVLRKKMSLLKIIWEILSVCKNRKVVFDNRTKDKGKQTQQRKSLLAMVDEVMNSNGGQLYTNELFQELIRAEKEILDLKEGIKLFESIEKSNSELYQPVKKRLDSGGAYKRA
ncbi:immune-associated nucleotide-binding protein 9-like [Impatiens glandulifera]|uniref:immune-associated nucleotide-binding protein 9-like n=1 Tax=Impatiens glandulifera TaxID=253017 RepID=UPI001FB0E8E7|nr:immune-associated nucleotide-binding protein 9-like [Impatiens glandulifera]